MNNAEYLKAAQARYSQAKRQYENAEQELSKTLAGASFTGWLANIDAGWKHLHLDSLLTAVIKAEEDLVETFRNVMCDDPTVSPALKHKIRVLIFTRHPEASAKLLEMAQGWRDHTERGIIRHRLVARRIAAGRLKRDIRRPVSFLR